MAGDALCAHIRLGAKGDFSDLTAATMDSLATLLGDQLTVLQTISDYLTGGGADAVYLQTLAASLGALQGQFGLANTDLVIQLAAPMGALTTGLASLVAAINLDIADRAARAAADAASQSVAAAAEAARLAAAQLAAAEAARVAAAAAATIAAQVAAAAAAAAAAAENIPRSGTGLTEHGGFGRFAAGGDHTGGLRLVGENGPELEATGPSRIFTASQTQRMLQGSGNGGGFAAVVGELRSVRREISNLRDQQRQLDTQILSESRKSRKTTDDWNINGMPGVRTI
ncbi:hypothetical protein [Cypionkella sp. TWP1-2-1b2]|uniref:hypothetical protein n=1 Tax=Cypionkella sp. TWP1-2-1b2 TaxID=2804675 RepID=UPI003CF5AAAB